MLILARVDLAPFPTAPILELRASVRICSRAGVPAFAQTAPVVDRVTQQDKLFDEFYKTRLKDSSERATFFGDYRYNALLGQYSLAEIDRQHGEADDFLKRLKATPTGEDVGQGSAKPRC